MLAEPESIGGTAQEAVEDLAVDFFRSTPIALAALAISFLSGQLWVFVIFEYMHPSKKANKALDNAAAKAALGLLWFALVLVPFYYIQFDDLSLEYQNILQLTVPTLVLGLFAQAIAFAFFAKVKK